MQRILLIVVGLLLGTLLLNAQDTLPSTRIFLVPVVEDAKAKRTTFGTPVAAPTAGLSEKELRVLEQLALGRSNREIASELWVSDQTVKFHLRNVYRKLGATTRTDAIRIAHERALLTSAA